MDAIIQYYNSPFGVLKIQSSNGKITGLSRTLCNYIKTEDNLLTKKLKLQLDQYFSGQRKVFDIPIDLNGTEFQNKVWKILIDIPYGHTCSYQDVANKIGNSNASRAVGMANKKNPIIILVPCHRVIGKNGKMVGYSGGLEIKEYLLNLEYESTSI